MSSGSSFRCVLIIVINVSICTTPLSCSSYYMEAGMTVLRFVRLMGLSVYFMSMLMGCTTQSIHTPTQDSRIDLLAQCEVEFRQGNTVRAIETASEAVRLTPDRADAWNARGFILASQGLNGQAVEDFSKAISLNPRNPVFHNNA